MVDALSTMSISRELRKAYSAVSCPLTPVTNLRLNGDAKIMSQLVKGAYNLIFLLFNEMPSLKSSSISAFLSANSLRNFSLLEVFLS